MRNCKVKGCNRKHWGKGYCRIHYQRNRSGKPLIRKCKGCGEVIEHLIGRCQYCERCGKKRIEEYNKKVIKKLREEYVNLPSFNYEKGKGMSTKVYTNGFTEELKPLVSKIRDKVLKDCIKNPRKYLDDLEK